MGHREELLIAAKRCLYEKGYGRTTTRDIVNASGTNLASIGYHFGSKEALLNRALLEAIGEWGERLGIALSADLPTDAEPLDRFRAIWDRIMALFSEHRALWAANFEVFAQVEHVPEVRAVIADGMEQGREGLARMFHSEITDERTARAVGSFYQALITGLMAQWLIDPEHAPNGEDLTEALRVIATGVGIVTTTQ